MRFQRGNGATTLDFHRTCWSRIERIAFELADKSQDVGIGCLIVQLTTIEKFNIKAAMYWINL